MKKIIFASAAASAVVLLVLAPQLISRLVPKFENPETLAEARQKFKTQLVPGPRDEAPILVPPPGVFKLVRYKSAVGELGAYVTPDPGTRGKRPAIVWITGGDCNSIGDVWSPADPANDQTAAAYRKAKIIMMFPSLRGGNDNPGQKEGFLGEVDDVLAASRYLASLPYVDPKRIYLGGHSTGGTLALLVAESSPMYRAVFSFGPVGNVGGYGAESGFLPFNTKNEEELKVRSPALWLKDVQSPTFIIEGTDGGSNIDQLKEMEKLNKHPWTQFVPVKGRDHFSVLAPMNEVLAEEIKSDLGVKSKFGFAVPKEE